MSTRVAGERLRTIHHLYRLRTIVEQLILDMERGAPIPGPDVAQAVAHTGVDVARALSALAAFDLASRDAPKLCGEVFTGDEGETYVCALDKDHIIPGSDHTDAMGLAQWPSKKEKT